MVILANNCIYLSYVIKKKKNHSEIYQGAVSAIVLISQG